jgi:hypothetical protein
MPQNPDNVVNPDLADVVDQGDGPTVVDQPVLVGPSTNPGPLVAASSVAPGLGNDSPDQPVTTSAPATTALHTVEGGTFSPQSPSTVDTTQNTVVGQTYGLPNPANVFV